MTEVIDTVEAHTLESGDLVEYQDKKGSHTMTVSSVEDKGDKICIGGVSHDTGDTVTKNFEPDDLFDLLGA